MLLCIGTVSFGRPPGWNRSSNALMIHGTVVNEKGDPLAGASVMEKGGKHGTMTNQSGNFHLAVNDPNGSLIVSYSGYATTEVKIDGKTQILVTLKQSGDSLGDVVVVGYGSQRKREVTGAISTVKGLDLDVAPIASTSNALGGLVPGLISQQETGQPGRDAASLSIRGFGTPLIIVDGIQTDFNNINPTEIATVTVLKDASAAIYGARSGNGVILVTTKRGKSGKPIVSYNSSYTAQSYIALPKMVTSGQYAQEQRDFDLNTGVNPNQAIYTQDQVNSYYAGNNPAYPNTDWWKAAMNNAAPQYKNDLSVSGGNDNIRYYTFAGILKQYGFARSKDNVYNRYNFRTNVDAKISKYLSMEVNVAGIADNVTSTVEDMGDAGGFWNDYYWSLPTASAFLPDKGVPYAGSATAGNPIVDTRSDISGSNKNSDLTMNGSLALNFKIPGVPGLSVRGFFNYLDYRTNQKIFNTYFQTYSYNYTTKAYTPGLSGSPTSVTESTSDATQRTRQFSVNYDNTFNSVHHISALLLYEGIDSSSSGFYAGRMGYLTTSIPYLFAGSTATSTNGDNANVNYRASVVGRINYGFEDRYFLQGTLRYDGSPNFPPSTRWGLFPSVSGAWLLSQENFMKASPISNLKLRLSYSNTGYDNVGQFEYITGYALSQVPWSANGNTQTGIATTGLANPNITWEQMHTYDAGVDFGIFDNKIYGTADVFYRLRAGILGTKAISLPTTFGAVLPSENINSYGDRGFEVMIGYKHSSRNFSYDISVNVAYTRAKWIHYDEPAYTTADEKRVDQVTGKWTDLIWGYKSAGLFASQADISGVKYVLDGNGNKSVKPGDIKYVDLNGDGVIDWRDEVKTGTGGIPRYLGGLNFNVTYKKFQLIGLFQGAAGKDVSVEQAIDSRRGTTRFLFENMYSTEHPNLNALFPLQDASSYNNYPSDFFIKNASYLRLKNLSLGYNFTHLFPVAAGISNVRLYIAATNILTISGLTKYGVDPEYIQTNYGAVPGSIYPKTKTVSAGINVSF